MRIADPESPVTEDFGNTYTFSGNLKTPFTGKVGKGFFIEIQSTQNNVPGLACGIFGKQVSYGCDRDVGNGYISHKRNWCLFIINPFANMQKADVAVSFTESVFKVPFSSPNPPNLVSGNETLPDTETGYNFVKGPSSKRKRDSVRNKLRTRSY
jgi:hypothetical protein